MVTLPPTRSFGLLLLLGFCACRPTVEGRPSLIDRPRVLALSSSPAEGKPGDTVTYQALYVGPDGSADVSALDWALCTARKPLAATGAVAQACFSPKGASLIALGSGESAVGNIPKDACQVFGPTPPAPLKGQPNGRPADPDTTGGYFQPARVLAHVPGDAEDYSVAMTRLACGLGGATQEQAASYSQGYRENENPALSSLALRHQGRAELLELAPSAASPLAVRPGEQVTLRASWATCPLTSECGDEICGPGETLATCPADCTTPHGCQGSEPYAYFDPLARTVRERRESIRVSWFANDGSFEHDRTGRSESDAAVTYTDNNWTAPDTEGSTLLWVVIRDDRGGVGWGSYNLLVER